MLALGLFTRPVALVIFIFHVNALIEHWRFDGYFWNKLGLEYAMIWAAATLIFVVQGGGPYALDAWLVGARILKPVTARQRSAKLHLPLASGRGRT